MEAENASQLQYLKTLDSIEAKTQQLQTSLQALYVSSGIENFYKTILDVTNNIAQTFTNMPTIFSLPIPAIISFGSTFYSLASVVTNVFGIILNRLAVHKEQVTTLLTNEANKQIQIEKQASAKRLADLKDANDKEEAEEAEHQATMTELRAGNLTGWMNGRRQGENLEANQQQYGKVKNVNAKSMGLNLLGLGLGLASTGLKSSSNEATQAFGGVLGIGARAASGAAMGSVGGAPGMVAGAVIGGLAGALENLNVILPSTKVQIENLTKAATETNNKLLQQQADTKSLQDAIQKLEELKKARYDSVEAEKAYLEANDALAAKYPELVSSYAETGEAIINLDSATNLLTTSLEQTVKATEDASTANVKLALKRHEEEQDEIDQLKDVRDSDSAGKAADIINAIIASKDKDISNSFDSGALRQLGMVDSFSFAEAISQGKDLNSSEISKSFSSYIKNYLENNLQELASQKSKISVQVLSPIEKFIYDYIDSQVNQISSIDSREIANNKKLQTTIKGNILNDINSYLNLIRQAEDSNPFEGMDEASAIIKNYIGQSFNIDEINTIEEWNKAQDSAQEATQEYYDALVNWYSSIDKETYKNIMSFKGQVSSNTLINMLKASFGKIPEEILKGFSETYKDEFDRTKYLQAVGKIDNKGIKDALFRINQQTFNQLSDAERHAILDYGKQIELLIASGQVTQNQGLENLNKYIAIWSELRVADIAPEQREAAEGLLRTWDGTREGLEGIITSLEGLKGANAIIQAVKDLIESIPQNLNTAFAQISTSIASEIKTMDDAIKDLSKGVDMAKAIEYANKLDLSLKDFQLDYSTGLFTLNDTQEIVNKQIANIQDQINAAQSLVDKVKNEDTFQSIGGAKPDVNTLRTFSNLDLSKESKELTAFNQLADNIGIGPKELQGLLQRYFNEVTETSQITFTQWVESVFQTDINYLTSIKESAQARGALQLGDLNGFLEQMGVSEENFDEVIQSLLSNNGFNYEDITKITGQDVADEMQKYATAISEALGDVTKNAVDAAISSITNGKVENIKVTQANEGILRKLGAKGIETGSATLDWSDTDASHYQARVQQILSSGMSPENINAALSDLESAVYNIDISEAIDSIISSYEGFGIEAANKFAQALGGNLQDFVDSGIFDFEELTGKYSADLSTIRAYAATAAGLTDKQKNAALASIDKKLRKTSVQSTFSDLVKNANNLSEEIIQSFADSTGQSYQTLATLWKQDDGTYKVDLKRLSVMRQSLKKAGNDFAAGVLDSVIDEYINQLSNISKAQTSGYTNLSDMRAVADKFANGDLGIFDWDNELKAYTLTNEGIMQQAHAAATQLASLDKKSEEYKITFQLMQADGQALANNIDAMSFVSALQAGDTVNLQKVTNKFTRAINNYVAYCTGLEESIDINADVLKSMLADGGRAAVMAAQQIAAWKGENLNASDINTLYRSEIDKVNKAAEQLTHSVGEIIDANTWAILKGISGFHASEIANGQYVIDSVGDLVAAHEALYTAMRTTNEATTRELNAEWAKIQSLKSGKETIEYLSQAAEMTYETFGEALASVGIDAGASDLSALYRDLGNGKIEITNFKAFSDLLGLTSENTEAYIAAYKEFNSKKIQSENQQRQALESEINSLSTAKFGDKIDLTTLYFKASEQFSEESMANLETSLRKYGAIFQDGILDLSEATSIPDIINILKNQMQDIDVLTEQDFASLADALDNFFKNLTNQINKGIKGTLTNKDKLDLQQNLKGSYGVQLSEMDFTQTTEGLKLSEQAAIRIWAQLDKIDKMQAKLVFKDLSDSLIKTNENFKTMSSTMNRIGELRKLIADNDNRISSARLNQYKEELAVAEEIAKVRATSKDDSYNFMSAELPAAMDNPLNYIENWGKAFEAIKQSDKKGYMGAKDFARIVNEMNRIAGLGQQFEMYGVTLDGSLDAASKLIQAGFSHIKSIDGEGVVDIKGMMASLGNIGTAFEAGALEMKGGVTDGIHAVAQANIDMLDSMIAILETVVGMQNALATVDENGDNELGLDEIFENLERDLEVGDGIRVTNKFGTAATKILEAAKKNPELEKALQQITIDNHTLSDLLDDAKDGILEAEINYEAFASIMNSFYKMSLSDDFDENNIYESLQQVMESSGLNGQSYDLNLDDIFITVHEGKIAKINWDDTGPAEAIKQWIKEHAKELKGKKQADKEKAAKEALAQIFKNGNEGNEFELTEDLDYYLLLNGVTKVDVKDGQDYYEYKGQRFYAPEQVLEAIKLERDENLKDLTTNYDPEDPDKQGTFTITGTIAPGLQVEIVDGEKTYIYNGFRGSSIDEAIDAYIRGQEGNENLSDEQVAEKRTNIKLEQGIDVVPKLNVKVPKTFKGDKNDTQAFMELLSGDQPITGKDIKQKFGIETGIEGELSTTQLQEIAKLFGVEYKPTVLQLTANTDGIDANLQEVLSKPIINRTIQLTFQPNKDPTGGKDGGTPPKGAEGETEQTYDITGAVKIIATSLQSVDLSQILKDEGISVNDIIKVAGTIAELILTGTPKIPLEQEYDSKASVNVKATIATLVAALGTASYVLGPLLAQASNNPIINAFLSSLIGLIQDGTVVTAPTGATASNNPDINADIGTLTGNVGAGSKVEVPGNVDAPTGTTITINGVTYTLGPVGAQNQFDTARIIAGALAALGVINGSLTIPQAIQLLYKINPQQDPASAAELAVKKDQIPKDAAAGLGANQGQDGGYSISDPISIKVMYTTLLEKAKEGQLPAGQTKESLITDALSWVNGEYKDGTLTVDQAISILYSATVSKKPDDISSGSNTGAPADADDQSQILAMLAEYGIQPEMTLTEAIKILYTANPELKTGDSGDGAQEQSAEDKIKEQVNIPTEIEGPSVTVNIPVIVKPVGGGEPDVSDAEWNYLHNSPEGAQMQFDPADASGNPNSLLNKYNSFLSNGGILSDDTVSKLQNLKGSFAGDYSGIDKLLELNNLNLNSENLKLSEGLSQVLQMPSDNIQGIANAISQLVTSATQLQAIQWGEIATKMAELFSNGGAGEGAGETGTDAASMVSKTLNLNVVTNIDEYAKILLSDTTIEKTVKLNVEGGEGGDGSDGGDGTKNPASQTPASQTPSGTTETGNLDTTNIQNALSSVQQAFNEVATAANGVQDLADATKDINDDAAKPFKTIADNAGAIGTAAKNVSDLVSAIKDIPDKKEINVSVMFSPGNSVDVMLNIKTSTSSDSSDGETKQQKAKGTVKVKSIEAEPSSVKATTRVNFRQSRYQISDSKAKGTIDKAAKTKGGQGGTRKTLMGELGPELVVADNMYYVVGEDGAEYIDLPKDAIVFNHLLTKKLLSTGHTGRGTPITNERNAVSFATGNVSSNGPAMASASAALAALKQIRAMWASMLNASAKDLGSQAGRGGGGGKGKDDAGDKYKQPTNVIRDIQRWYNLERQIAKLEAEITYQQKLQSKYETDRVANGQLIYESQRKQLESLQQQIVRQRELAKLQRSWYDNKRAELAASSYGKIFTYDENGLQQYVGTGKPGSGLGLDILENLTRRDVNGKPIGNAETAKKQLAYLAKQGFDLNELIWNDDGTKVVESISSNLKLKKIKDDETDNDELYAKLMENFWDAVDGWQEELDSLYDGIDKTLADIEDNQKQQNEILQAFVDNEISVENELLKAIEAREKAVIDKLEDQKSALEDSTKKFIDGIKNALDKDKQAAEDNEEQQALEKLQRQLAILQRSGGSASQIRQLQDQIASKQQDMYYNERQEQLDAIQEASDKQIERLDEQINLLNEALEYQKENGLFWNEVREWMLKSDDIVSDFYNQWVVSPSGKSALQQEEDLRNFKESFQEWIGYRDQKETDKIADEEFNAIENDNEFQDSNSQYLKGMTEDEQEIARIDARAAAQQAKSQYLKEHEGEADAEEQANREAVKAYHSSLRDSYFNSENNVQVKKDFEQHYEDWIYNKRLNPDTKDKGAEFVKSTTFANNEAEFKNAMLENYLDNLGSNYDEKTAWGNAINAGEEALLNLGEAQQAEGKKTVGKLTKKSFGYAFKQDEDKSKTKKTKISYPKNAELTFKDARYDNKNNKLLQIADKDGKGLNAWVFANNVSNGSSIFDLLYNGAALTGNKENIDELSNMMDNLGGDNGYYDPRRTINLPNITGITSGQLTGKSAFNASTFRTEKNEMVPPSKKNNTITITDVKGLKWDSKNKIKTLSGVQVSQVQPSGGQMETLQNPTWIGGKALLKKIKNQLNAKLNDQLRTELKYLNAYKEGGIIDFTGPAWVDGTKARPESILSADQTAFLREDLLGNSNTSLKSILATVADSFGGNISTNNNSRTDDSVVIENIDVTFESGVIDSDYDMKRASDMFKDELVRIARKSGNRNVSRR